MVNKLKLTKKIAGFVATYGSSVIVGTIIKNQVHPNKLYQKAAVAVGGFAIGALVTDAANRKMDEIFDDFVQTVHKFVNE